MDFVVESKQNGGVRVQPGHCYHARQRLVQEMAHRQGIRNTDAVDDYVVMNDAGIGGDQIWSANSNDML